MLIFPDLVTIACDADSVWRASVRHANGTCAIRPTRRREIDLTRQVGDTLSRGAVNPTTDGSSLNAEVIGISG